MESAAFSGSSKRGRATIPQIANCLVDGCTSDLSKCREYHRRHKVCESHSKTAKVSICGREQRFCQQCSRFHSLSEFDEGKRSCRKRLDGHNRRRRKPQPDTLSRNPGLLFSNQQGTRLLSFGNRETFVSSIPGSNWADVGNSDQDMSMYSNQTDLNYIYRQNMSPRVNQFQFMQGSEPPPLLDQNSPSGNSTNCSQKIFTDGLTQNQVVDSDGALSLLSSSAPVVSREIGLNYMVQHNDQSLAHNMLFNGQSQSYSFSQEIESKPEVLVRDSRLHFQEMFQNGGDGSSTSGSQQTLTFMWE